MFYVVICLHKNMFVEFKQVQKKVEILLLNVHELWTKLLFRHSIHQQRIEFFIFFDTSCVHFMIWKWNHIQERHDVVTLFSLSVDNIISVFYHHINLFENCDVSHCWIIFTGNCCAFYTQSWIFKKLTYKK